MIQLTLRLIVGTLLFGLGLFGQTVRFHTNVGDIDVVLTPNAAPQTVANFLNYLNTGEYLDTVFHRSVPGFVIQGGGYQLQNHTLVASAQNAAIPNEFNVTNARGTIAMALTASSSGVTDPNSGTNQWFFNLVNNGSQLDSQKFTVFGHVANTAGLAIMDRIAAFPVYNLGAPFDQLPLNNYNGSGTLLDGNYVQVTSIVTLPAFSAAGVESAASFGPTSTNGIAPGELLTIYGSNIGPATLTTLTIDANGIVTNTLAGTQVLFDGTPGAMIFTTSGQLSVVAPYNLAGKSVVNVVVVYQGAQTASLQFPVVAANPAIFTLNTSGKGDAAIVRFPDASVVSTANSAAPGDILELYGEGYGTTTPLLANGLIIGSTLPMPVSPVILLIDGQPVNALYAGGAPSLVNGVLQINFTVPQLAPGSHSVQLQVGSRTSPAGVNLQTR